MSRNFELLHQLNGSPQSEVYTAGADRRFGDGQGT